MSQGREALQNLLKSVPEPLHRGESWAVSWAQPKCREEQCMADYQVLNTYVHLSQIADDGSLLMCCPGWGRAGALGISQGATLRCSTQAPQASEDLR